MFFRLEVISWLDMEIASRRILAMTSWFDFNNTLTAFEKTWRFLVRISGGY
jgi:hypothetical protein